MHTLKAALIPQQRRENMGDFSVYIRHLEHYMKFWMYIVLCKSHSDHRRNWKIFHSYTLCPEVIICPLNISYIDHYGETTCGPNPGWGNNDECGPFTLSQTGLDQIRHCAYLQVPLNDSIRSSFFNVWDSPSWYSPSWAENDWTTLGCYDYFVTPEMPSNNDAFLAITIMMMITLLINCKTDGEAVEEVYASTDEIDHGSRKLFLIFSKTLDFISWFVMTASLKSLYEKFEKGIDLYCPTDWDAKPYFDRMHWLGVILCVVYPFYILMRCCFARRANTFLGIVICVLFPLLVIAVCVIGLAFKSGFELKWTLMSFAMTSPTLFQIDLSVTICLSLESMRVVLYCLPFIKSERSTKQTKKIVVATASPEQE